MFFIPVFTFIPVFHVFPSWPSSETPVSSLSRYVSSSPSRKQQPARHSLASNQKYTPLPAGGDFLYSWIVSPEYQRVHVFVI